MGRMDRRRFLVGIAGVGSAATLGGTGPTRADASGASGGEELWTFRTGGPVNSSPAVTDEVIYVGSHDGSIYAIDAETGDRRWSFETGGSVRSSPAVYDEAVYVGSDDGRLYALDAVTGDERWSVRPGSADVRSSPTTYEGTVYAGEEGGDVVALDAGTGERRWTFETGATVRSSPTVVDATESDAAASTGGRVYVGSGAGRDPESAAVFALDADTGDPVWTFEADGGVRSSPTVSEGTVYVGSRDSNLYALDAGTGDERWRFETGGEVIASPTVHEGSVYVGSFDGHLYAVGAASGEKRWSVELVDFVSGFDSSPTVAAETVYVGETGGAVYALDRDSGDKRWEFETGSGSFSLSSPIVHDGVLYAGSLDRGVYAIDAGADRSSDGSRVALETLGEIDETVDFAGGDRSSDSGRSRAAPKEPATAPDADPDREGTDPLPGPGAPGALASVGAAYLLRRRTGDRRDR